MTVALTLAPRPVAQHHAATGTLEVSLVKMALMTVRIVGLLVLLLGLALWTGSMPALVPIHMLLGLILVIALVTAAVIGLRKGIAPALPAVAIVWAIATLVLGLTQRSMLPDAHAVVQVAHLAMGLVAIGIGEALGARSRRTAA